MKLSTTTLAVVGLVVAGGGFLWWRSRQRAASLKTPAPAAAAAATTGNPWADVAVAGIGALGAYLGDSKSLRNDSPAAVFY